MAFTKLYLTNRTAPYTPATLRGAWDQTAGAVTKALDPAREGGGVNTTVAIAETNVNAGWDVLLYRGVSGPLAAQTINCNVDVLLGVRASLAAGDLCYHVHIYVTQGDSDTPRVTLLSDYTELVANKWNVSAFDNAQAFSAPQAVNQAVSAGDRLVVEIGYVARNTVTTSYSGTLFYGTQDATLALLPDLTGSETTPQFNSGFITFSASVTEPALTGRVSAQSTRTLSAVTPTARVSSEVVRTLSAVTPTIRISHLSVRTLTVRGAATGFISRMSVRTLSVNPTPSGGGGSQRAKVFMGDLFGNVWIE